MNEINCKPPSRIYNQYAGKSKINSWFNSTYAVGESICTASNAVKNSYAIDINSGAQLDVIGRILNQSRGYIDNVTFEVVQFDNVGDVNQFGDEENQCSAVSGAADSELSDAYYRLLLKSKVSKNNNTCSSDDILTAMKEISPVADFQRVVYNGDMSITLEYSGQIDAVTEFLLTSADIVPLSQGVNLKDVVKV